ncbi:TetR family transcriptional regulator [Saccharopolyspora erythraea NRRL 2338]|uniref:TetR-family transcriptional regulator n=2 Tax=Saccharopolyspora erythraea TaxID=1836 RepID=A4FEP4_SACEN|nr:TetR/AcrR family transcriptional regulator [Saccharopolyspora erythraea]PFG96244.1 TetR family transcriptional regulator [Saccharopolyspora erythraea NRRL 2338]QRK92768.1 TetR/AcrR family transcriptional regulator [Saccharopolyspora erythraea]CAM02519.1 TetR-family transcriptional regulator [Saccharopolyspora erythraea NRRL 2338]
MTATAARRPQQDRSRATRRRLLEAAVDSLAEHGWTGTTVSVVAERAGVSRGAAQHHFPTREDLVTAAVSHVTDARISEIQEQITKLPRGKGRTEGVVDILVRLYTGTVFRAALQLWVAASSDEALREQVVPVEARVGREAHRLAVELLGVDESVPGVRETVQATLDMARGLGLANVLTDDSRRRRGIVRQWARTLDAVLEEGRRPES